MSLLEDFHESSKKISETLRNVSYGIIATDFGILTFKIEFFKEKLFDIETLVVISIIASILGILFDYFNALFLYINTKYKIENKIDYFHKGKKSIYFLGYFFFYAKQIIILFAAILLIFAIWKVLECSLLIFMICDTVTFIQNGQ